MKAPAGGEGLEHFHGPVRGLGGEDEEGFFFQAGEIFLFLSPVSRKDEDIGTAPPLLRLDAGNGGEAQVTGEGGIDFHGVQGVINFMKAHEAIVHMNVRVIPFKSLEPGEEVPRQARPQDGDAKAHFFPRPRFSHLRGEALQGLQKSIALLVEHHPRRREAHGVTISEK